MQEMVIKNKKLRFLNEGQGFPLLLGHSFLFDHTMWQPQIDELKKSYRVIAVDLWGHGQSDELPSENNYVYDTADDMWQLMQNLKIDKFALIGLSIGGMWGVKLALDHPENVSALALFGSHVGVEPKEKKIEYEALFSLLKNLGVFTEPLAQSLLQYFYCPHTFLHKKELPMALKASLMAIPTKNIPSILSIGAAIFERETLLPRLHHIRCPTLIAVGSHDIARPPHDSQEMAALITSCEYHEISNAGHITSLEQPEKVNELIRTFLRRSLLF